MGWTTPRALYMLLALLTACPAVAQDGVLDGLLEPNERVEVSSQVPGIIDSFAVERGDRVKKGQVLVQLKSGLERVAVDLARAQVEFERRQAARNEELYRKQLLSVHEKDEMETKVRIAELQLEEATERYNMRTIRSPVAGVVVDRRQSPGEFVTSEPILTVAAVDPLNVEVIAPAALIGSVTVGMAAEVRLEAPIGGSYTGRVVIVDPLIDAASGTFGVRVELPNGDYRLPAGLTCTVRFSDTAP